MKTRFRVCIDPGHPSESGIGCRGRVLAEVDLVWKIGVRLQALLRDQGFDVRLTKSKPRQFASNRRRAAIAAKFRADLFLRLHCDAAEGSGFAVYHPDRQGTDPQGYRGPSKQVCADSTRLATVFHESFARRLRQLLPDNGIHPDTRTSIGAKQGALTGSIHAKQAVLLVELCVLTNPSDEKNLGSAAGMETAAQALRDGCAATARAHDQGRGSNPRKRNVSGRWESQ